MIYNKCKNLLLRKRKYVPYFWCKCLKKQITFDECENCSKRNVVPNKAINKKSSKKIAVSNETYDIVVNRDNNTCRLKDATCNGMLELHHIVYRSEDKKLIDEPSNCIMLCNAHHRLVHSNKHMWQPILKNMIKK